MISKLSVNDINVKGKRVFCRVDFNVPLDNNLEITDDTRIRAALPTIDHLISKGAKVILASHLGRPKSGPESKFSLLPAANRLSELIGKPVTMAPDSIGPEVERLVNELKDGDILLLENVRFHAGETKNDPEFSKALARLADTYVNDAFGTAHRAHASTEGVASILPTAAAGFLLEKEIDYLGNAVQKPQRPLVAIIGGAKVSDKILVIETLLSKVDSLIIGGGMAYTFLRAQGIQTGSSLVEEDRIELAGELIDKAKKNGVALLLPIDHIADSDFKADAENRICPKDGIPEGWMGLDIGPESIELYQQTIKDAGTVIWNGPMGVFEFPAFAKGTFSLATALAESNAISIIGGGDSVAAVNKSGLQEKMSHISTGGGASLEFLEGKTLPGIAVLTDK